MANQKNIGEQIGEAIQSAIADQDFSQLQQTVKQGIDYASRSISTGLARAAQATREMQAGQPHPPSYPSPTQPPAPRRTSAARFGSVTGLRIGGYLMAIGGGILAASMLVLGLVTYGASFIDYPDMPAGTSTVLGGTSATFFAFFAAFAVLTGVGIGRTRRARRFVTYRNVIGDAEAITIAELAQRSAQKPARVIKDLRKMTARGLFAQGRLDDEETTFFVTTSAYETFLAERQAARERRHQELLEREAAMRTADGAPITPEAQAILDKGSAYIEQIRQRNAGIPGAEVSRKISQIEVIVDSIFAYAKEHPAIIDDLDQLLDYYLPVTVKLLDAYEDLDRQPVQTESIRRSKREIEETLDTLNAAFSKLLDSIFMDMTWDVSADISVLHTVLAQEGLTDNPFESKGGEKR